jgi:hypothetical protein
MRTVQLRHSPRAAVRNSVFRCVLVIAVTVSAWQAGAVPGTNAFFSDNAQINGSSVSAGMWIPTVKIASVTPTAPNGQYDQSIYRTRPCVKLSYDGISFGTATIWYEFSDDGDPKAGGTQYVSGACIDIPDGAPAHFQAVAIHDMNHDWRSAVVSRDFKVDTKCPEVDLNGPDEGDVVSGSVDIRGTLSDANPHHYWLVIERGSSSQGPGVVNDTETFSDKRLYTWDTTKVPDGTYVVKFEARDQAGNKCDDKSIDWNTVTVRNTPSVNPVVGLYMTQIVPDVVEMTGVSGVESTEEVPAEESDAGQGDDADSAGTEGDEKSEVIDGQDLIIGNTGV